jgi:heat shock protein HtpX
MPNSLKTVVLLSLLIGFVMFAGELMGGRDGLVLGFVLSLGMTFVSYWFSDSIILSMYGARRVEEGRFPELHEMVERLARKAGINKPDLYIIPSSSPNAFATGRGPSKSAVAVTEGILAILDRQELEGVLAHEIAHVANYDVLLSSVVAAIAGSLSFASRMFLFSGGRRQSRDGEEGTNPLLGLVLMIVAPLVAMLIQMAISRSREYLADESGAAFCDHPEWLARALQKLEHGVAVRPYHGAETATSHMFIVHPFSGSAMMNWFSTHPPMDERIRRLRAMANGGHG